MKTQRRRRPLPKQFHVFSEINTLRLIGTVGDVLEHGRPVETDDRDRDGHLGSEAPHLVHLLLGSHERGFDEVVAHGVASAGGAAFAQIGTDQRQRFELVGKPGHVVLGRVETALEVPI